MQALSTSPELKPFVLRRWFAAVGVVSIGLLSVSCAALLSQLIADRMLQQEGMLTMQFMQSIMEVEKAAAYFEQPQAAPGPLVEELLEHLATVPDTLRVNVYGHDQRVLWSSESSLVGKRFNENRELEEALAGSLQVETGAVRAGEHSKAEHQKLEAKGEYFIEIYMPVWDDAKRHVVGAVELYRTPQPLFQAIQAGQRIIWVGALVAGGLLYLALFSLIRRADNLIRRQQERLVEAETMAAVGDVASAVAHGIRNPLAAIRSSAEVAGEADAKTVREALADIIAQVDRVEQWVRELLTYARPVSTEVRPVLIQAAVAESLHDFARDIERLGIAVTSELPGDLPAVRGDPLLLGQVVHSLLANAVQAGSSGHRISVSGAVTGERGLVALRIEDSGPGMSSAQLGQVFKPFYTTKPRGLGLGLPVVKRIVERLGGQITITSRRGVGTTVEVLLPPA